MISNNGASNTIKFRMMKIKFLLQILNMKVFRTKFSEFF
ncbi:hypothetical protein BpHYR1_033380 [Brachionus plicatilis]|uniref:Uncharacterized protein n=1 Tax=Brachionus plicatilis TaxID=10195 RepID=A0A3M7P375_BRAPC|nr:hypothetical protein BpHYR1_033380 [Brachionus plicatilis]